MKRIFFVILLFILFPVCTAATESSADSRVKMTAEVLSVKDELLVRVLESDYAFGPYTVITGEGTVYLDSLGKKAARDDIKVGDRVEIFYNGQVMMSYPPKIVARKIIII